MMVNRAECTECGAQVDYLARDGPLACGDCGAEMEFAGKVGCVGSVSESETPNEALRELIDDWRKKQSELDLPRSGLTDEGHMVKKCADELEQLTEGETDNDA